MWLGQAEPFPRKLNLATSAGTPKRSRWVLSQLVQQFRLCIKLKKSYWVLQKSSVGFKKEASNSWDVSELTRLDFVRSKTGDRPFAFAESKLEESNGEVVVKAS